MTEAQLFAAVLNGGTNLAFGILFIWLLMDTRRESKQREERLMQALDKLAKAYDELAFVRRVND